nr:transposase [Nonomuraea coxensis]
MRTLTGDGAALGAGRVGGVRLLRLPLPVLLGLRLHLLYTPGGLPVLYALSGAKADEREVLLGMLQAAPDVLAAHPGQTIIADRHYYGRVFEAELTERELQLLRPARQSEPERPGAALFKPLRQTIESINQTLKSQLDLERHGGRTHAGVIIRVLTPHPRADQRDLAQRQDRPADQAVSDRLRPLTVARPLGINHLAEGVVDSCSAFTALPTPLPPGPLLPDESPGPGSPECRRVWLAR